MKKIITLAGVFAICLAATAVYGQEETKEVRKEVRMVEKNGVKTLIITSTVNGETSEEIYTGEEAEAKLNELMDGRGETDEIKKEVEVEMVDGEKVVTITTSRKGKIRKEVYTGEEAEAKLKELETSNEAETGSIKKTENSIIEKK